MTVNINDTRVSASGSTYSQRCNLLASLHDRDVRHEYNKLQQRKAQGGADADGQWPIHEFGHSEPQVRRTGRKHIDMRGGNGNGSCPFDRSQLNDMRAESSRYGDFGGGNQGGNQGGMNMMMAHTSEPAVTRLPPINSRFIKTNPLIGEGAEEKPRHHGRRKAQLCRLPDE